MHRERLRGVVVAPGFSAADPAAEVARLVAEVARLEKEVAQLAIAVHTNRSIGVAVGLVMQRFGLRRATAHAYLVRHSQDSNTKLAVVAQELVDRAEVLPD